MLDAFNIWGIQINEKIRNHWSAWNTNCLTAITYHRIQLPANGPLTVSNSDHTTEVDYAHVGLYVRFSALLLSMVKA